MSSLAFITGETIPAFAGHLVNHSRRREDQRLAVGDSGVIVDDQFVAARTTVLARYLLTRRITDDEIRSLEERSNFISVTVHQFGDLVFAPISYCTSNFEVLNCGLYVYNIIFFFFFWIYYIIP